MGQKIFCYMKLSYFNTLNQQLNNYLTYIIIKKFEPLFLNQLTYFLIVLEMKQIL